MKFRERYPGLIKDRFEDRRRKPIYVTFQGQTKSLFQWSKHLGFLHGTLYHRLKYGWSIEKAFTTQPMTREETGRVKRPRRTIYKKQSPNESTLPVGIL